MGSQYNNNTSHSLATQAQVIIEMFQAFLDSAFIRNSQPRRQTGALYKVKRRF